MYVFAVIAVPILHLKHFWVVLYFMYFNFGVEIIRIQSDP